MFLALSSRNSAVFVLQSTEYSVRWAGFWRYDGIMECEKPGDLAGALFGLFGLFGLLFPLDFSLFFPFFSFPVRNGAMQTKKDGEPITPQVLNSGCGFPVLTAVTRVE